MITKDQEIYISGLPIAIVRKPIKNLHLGVYPPNGRVRVAAPLLLSDDAIRIAIIERLGWIRRQRAKFEGQTRESRRELVSGESHYFLGRRYRMRIVHSNGSRSVRIRSGDIIELHISKDSDVNDRMLLLQDWYRERLRELIPPLITKWERIIGVQNVGWGIRKMKTKWGSCSTKMHRVWLNLELIKKPPKCLEFIVVHELIHFLERRHSERFQALMNRHLMHWKFHRSILNSMPLVHEHWSY